MRSSAQALRASHQGPGSRAAGVAMAFKLIESAKTGGGRQRTHLAEPVRAGAVFKNGKLIERPDESEGGDQVA